MGRIELRGFRDRFSDGELDELERQLEDQHVELELDADDDAEQVAADLPDIALEEFLDRLRPARAAADLYVPLRFRGALKLYDLTIVSSRRLLVALRKIRERAEAAGEPLPKGQHQIWKRMRYGALQSIKRKLVLEIVVE